MLRCARRCSVMLPAVRASLESYVARNLYRETYSFKSYVELCTFVVIGSGGLAPLDASKNGFVRTYVKLVKFHDYRVFEKWRHIWMCLMKVIGFSSKGDPFWCDVIFWGSQGVPIDRGSPCEQNPLFGSLYGLFLREIRLFEGLEGNLQIWPKTPLGYE